MPRPSTDSSRAWAGGIGQGDSLPEAEAGRNWLIAEGIPADHLLIETQSRTTRQNLAFAQPLLADHGIHRVPMLLREVYHSVHYFVTRQ
ncbi:hypothetical protein A5698_23710 [Mycobacterium sp. E136]|uniref:YdcF family protein n=1 Tax=Mycobacterium sp. E136 TaxID=1834125 RepID=UPI0007FC2EB2|nr:YdcF family protein [Mycobacterium sp. E136]OBG89020.1 hypothetical protein A5698_23710 [Mycobacterium sp. E136]